MPEHCNKSKISQYLAAAEGVHELRLRVGQQIESAAVEGDSQAAHDALAELQASGEALHALRLSLTPTDRFIVTFNVVVHGPHEVSFVLRPGVSRHQILCEAQALVREREDRNLVWGDQLERWGEYRDFKTEATTSTRIHINGHVEGGDAKTRDEQETLLRNRGLLPASSADLATAFVAHYVATGEPLFGWAQNGNHDIEYVPCTFQVRASDGMLYYNESDLIPGLSSIYYPDDHPGPSFAVAAQLARIFHETA